MEHLYELQSRLKALNSKIRFEIDGYDFRVKVLYTHFSPFLYRNHRQVAIKKDDSNGNHLVELLIKGSPLRGCARVENYEELSRLLYEWLDKRSCFELLKSQFDDFEFLKPFPNKNLSTQKETIWIDIKSQLFYYYVVCWNLKESFRHYEKLMAAIKERKEFKNF